MPYFVVSGKNKKEEIKSMPGNFHFSIDRLIEELEEVVSLRIPAIIIFGIPEKKDARGSEAYNEKGLVQQALREIKKTYPELVIITDVCLCQYTDHGHCGVIENGEIVNDATLKLLAQMALSHASSGADMVAPSDMMDGRVKVIRTELDKNGFENVSIMAYSSKYASSFYGPFREAACSAPAFGDRRSYQMDPANSKEALREAELDIKEGADIVMVKPALSYLDIIYMIKTKLGYPVAAYNVSGEFAMIKSAASMGLIDEKSVVLEVLTSIKRAGADMILTYFAKDVARYLAEDGL
jgi:porphobilinogen synthase